VRAYLDRGVPLPPPDGRWARQIVDGARLSLVAFAALMILCMAPGDWWYLLRRNAPWTETPGRAILLALACTAWVTSWYSVWKLTSPAPRDDDHAPAWRARWARRVMTAYFVLPFVVGLTPTYVKNPPPGVLGLLGWLVPFACILLFALIDGLFRRTGGGWVRVEALVLALAASVTFAYGYLIVVAQYDRHGVRVGSLDLMFGLPLVQYGPPEILREVALEAAQGEVPEVPMIWFAVAVWAASLHLRLLWRYLPFAELRRRGAGLPAHPPDAPR
jgi:hypothetical protein